MMCTSMTGATTASWPRARNALANASASSRGRVTTRRMTIRSLEAREFRTRAVANLSGGVRAGGEGAGARMFASGIFAMDLTRGGPGIPPVQRQHFAAKEKIGAVHFGETRDGRAAGTIQRRKEATLAGNREIRFHVVDCRHKSVGRIIVAADFDADGALTESRQPFGRIQNFGVGKDEL